MEPMRFTIEQLWITDAGGRPVGGVPNTAYHVVEAESAGQALDQFLAAQGASVIGSVQVLPGFHAVATARREQVVFTIHIMPGSDGLLRKTTDREGIVPISSDRRDAGRDEDETRPRR